MEIKISIEKMHIWLVFFIVLAAGGFVFAQSGQKPDPGHIISEIGGLDQNGDGTVDNAEKVGGMDPSQLTNAAWDVIDYTTEDLNKDIFGTQNQRSIAELALACGGDYGCCEMAMTRMCQVKGYTFALGSPGGGSCGQGWCKGTGTCTVGAYCVKVANP